MSEQDKENCVGSVYNELAFVYQNASGYLRQRIKSPVSSSGSKQPLRDVSNIYEQDGLMVASKTLSVGTIIKREAFKNLDNYESLSVEEQAMIDTGMNGILDLTRGSLSNQKLLFTRDEWESLKAMFIVRYTQIELTPKFIVKITEGMKNIGTDLEETYWNVKALQKKATNYTAKTLYELLSILVDQLIKHGSIFTLSLPASSEADFVVKIWGNLFECLFYNTGLKVKWGETMLKSYVDEDGKEKVTYKTDMRIVLLHNNVYHDISNGEFAPYSSKKKVKSDRSKLMKEGKIIYNSIIKGNVNQKDADALKVFNLQVVGLSCTIIAISCKKPNLYPTQTVRDLNLPTSSLLLQNNAKDVLAFFQDFKALVFHTAEIKKSALTEKNRKSKSHKRKLDIGSPERANSIMRRISDSWDHNHHIKKKSKK